MASFLGIDTSNYTTSAAVYDDESFEIVQSKLLLPVKSGDLGIRQSDAVFHHTKQLPMVLGELSGNIQNLCAIGVSVRPRNAQGSYMPCFLLGESVSDCMAAVNNVPVFKTSHQTGHILAALYSCDKLDFVKQSFIAFHVSGGTTDCLLVEPDETDIIKITQLSSSLDLKAGQAVDRVGVMLGLSFPCGKELEALALKSEKVFRVKPVIRGVDCSLSGIENKCAKMLSDGEKPEDIARYCLEFICSSIDNMTKFVLDKFGKLPIVYAGGVMSNLIIRNKLIKKYGGYFATPEFSCDNAAGLAIFAALKVNK